MTSIFPHKEYIRYLTSSLVMVICSYATMLVDAAVGGHYLGKEAVSAINLVMPVNEVFYAVTLLLGLGATVVAAMDYGKGDWNAVRCRFTVAISSTAVLLLVMASALFLCRQGVVDMLVGGSSLHALVNGYLTAMIPWFVVNGLLLIFKEFTILCGKPTLVMVCAMVQFVVNIVCNIFFLGVLQWGIGALALSSLIAASVMFLLLFLNYLKRDCAFRWVHCSMVEYRTILMTHVRYGSGLFSGDIIYIVFTLVMNALVLRLMGENALFAWSVIIMVYYTINYASAAGQQTCIAIGGHYLGLKQKTIAQQINHRTYLFLAAWMLLVMVAAFIPPHWMMPIFGASDASQYALLLPVIALSIPFTMGNNILGLMLLSMLQQGRILLYGSLMMVMYFHLPLLLLLFHYLLPGQEWWCFVGMIPIEIILYWVIKTNNENS